MNIILGTEAAEPLKSKYTVLPLDDMKVGDAPVVTAYCVIEDIPLPEVAQLERTVKLHTKLVENYKKPDFGFCEQALEHLKGKWGKQLDSFYAVMEERIKQYKDKDLSNWDPVLYK
jgi:hypothetical protein